MALQFTPSGGLYDPANEHDGCGVAALARLDGIKRHEVVERALSTLDHLEHRGARGADPDTGDGAGILLQLCHEFIVAHHDDFGMPSAADVPPEGNASIAMCFLPADPTKRVEAEELTAKTVESHGHMALGWRDVPVDLSQCGEVARTVAPVIRQLLIGSGPDAADQDAFERDLFIVRRKIELATPAGVYFASFSSRTIVYKGMLAAPQLDRFYSDLRDPELASAVAIVHSRFSTNTFPSWELAHPHRYSAHNGEFNTLAGNVNWMRAREAALSSPELGEGLEDCLPLIIPGTSDSAAFDNAVELLCAAGRSLPHAMMMLIPRAHEKRADYPADVAAFFRYHSRIMEPWDGPAGVAFTDGRYLGAALDRNGLRPGRWLVTRDGWVAVSSEAGAFSVPDSAVEMRGRLRPNAMFLVDLVRGRVLEEGEIERAIAGQSPYGSWNERSTVSMDDLPAVDAERPEAAPTLQAQLAFGYSQEDLKVLLAPMARDSKEPTGSMGNDLSLAVLSERSPALFNYFKQRFAQVTNPAIDSVREKIVMSLRVRIGPQGNLLGEEAEPSTQLVVDSPVLPTEGFERLRELDSRGLRSEVIDITWPVSEGEPGIEGALDAICKHAEKAIDEGANVLILSDREMGPARLPIPSLLATSSVHHHLVRLGTRTQASLVVESGEPREVHHVATLIGFGASAVNPYLMLETVSALAEHHEVGAAIDPDEARSRTIAAFDAGRLKVLSKMGSSTIQSYCAAQIFEAVGLDSKLVEKHFTGTPSNIGGMRLIDLAREVVDRHARAYPESHNMALASHVENSQLPAAHEKLLPQGGVYAWRRDAERHMWDPETIAGLQQVARGNGDRRESYDAFAERVNEENAQHGLLRGLMHLREGDGAIDLEEVEPAAEIAHRFVTGAMSLGAL
ncbi:hypothetical protein BH10ACT11_BH10ACT11_12560 [soil metagenome]